MKLNAYNKLLAASVFATIAMMQAGFIFIKYLLLIECVFLLSFFIPYINGRRRSDWVFKLGIVSIVLLFLPLLAFVPYKITMYREWFLVVPFSVMAGVYLFLMIGSGGKNYIQRLAVIYLIWLCFWTVLYTLQTRQYISVDITEQFGALHVERLKDAQGLVQMEEMGVQYLPFFRVQNVVITSAQFSTYLMCLVPLLFIRGRGYRWILFGISVLIGIGVGFYFLTRQAFFASLVSSMVLFVLGFIKRDFDNKKLIRIGFLVFTLLVILAFCFQIYLFGLFERVRNLEDEARLIIYTESWDLIKRYPLGGGKFMMAGVGAAHNGLLEFGLRFGVFGLISFGSLMIVWPFWILSELRKKAPLVTSFNYGVLGFGLSSYFLLLVDNPNSIRLCLCILPLIYFLSYSMTNIRIHVRSNRRFLNR